MNAANRASVICPLSRMVRSIGARPSITCEVGVFRASLAVGGVPLASLASASAGASSSASASESNLMGFSFHSKSTNAGVRPDLGSLADLWTRTHLGTRADGRTRRAEGAGVARRIGGAFAVAAESRRDVDAAADRLLRRAPAGILRHRRRWGRVGAGLRLRAVGGLRPRTVGDLGLRAVGDL